MASATVVQTGKTITRKHEKNLHLQGALKSNNVQTLLMDARSRKVCVRRSPSTVDHVCVVRIVESGLLVLLVLLIVKDALLAVVSVATV